MVLKPTGTVQIVNKFSLIERKLLNGIIWHAQTRGPLSGDEKSLSILEVFQIIGLTSSRNREVIKEALTSLIGTVIRWNCLGIDRQMEWGACTFLSSGKLRGGKMFYRLNQELVEKINNPVLFAKITLLIQSQFRSRHSLVLYEFLVDNLCRRKTNTVTLKAVTVKEVLRLLDLDDTQYAASFKFFNSKVLKPSFEEINTCSDIQASYALVRKGRRVESLTFEVELRRDLALPLTMPTEIITETLVSAAPVSPAAIAAPAGIAALLERMTALGLTRVRANKLLAAFPVERIQANLELVTVMLQTPGRREAIDSIPGYFTTAVRENWAETLPKQEINAVVEPTAEQQQRDEEDWRKLVTRRLREKYAARDEAWKQQQQALLVQQAQAENNTLLLQAIRRSGFAPNGIAMRCLLAALKSELLREPEELSLDGYRRWRACSGSSKIAAAVRR